MRAAFNILPHAHTCACVHIEHGQSRCTLLLLLLLLVEGGGGGVRTSKAIKKVIKFDFPLYFLTLYVCIGSSLVDCRACVQD